MPKSFNSVTQNMTSSPKRFFDATAAFTRPPAAIVFDMDGLMFNTEDIYDEATHSLLNKRGHQFTREVKVQIMGRPGHVAWQIIVESYGLTEAMSVLQADFDTIFTTLLTQRIEMMPGLGDLLAHVRQRELPIAIATGSYRKFAEIALNHFQLIEHFSSILTSEDVTHGKPHPEIYLKTADALGVQPAEMIVFEDSLHGSHAAAASGAYTVVVPNPHCHDCDFRHADLIANSLADQRIYNLI
jgi:HAD superfamily hydrolase (TIGR01509 family)